jgi:hypothetical protein
MKRLPPTVFAVLALATVGAFYLTQHLKVSNPLINGQPRADPPAINPLAAGVCQDLNKNYVSFRATKVGFFLQKTASVVDVYVLNAARQRIATARGSGRNMTLNRYYYFSWDGREYGGGLAPDGNYELQALLQFDGRRIKVGEVAVLTTAPLLTFALTVDHHIATLRFTPAGYRSVMLVVYSAGAKRRLLVKRELAQSARSASWGERIAGKRAAPGTYLVGLQVRNASCTFGSSGLRRVTISRPRRHHQRH